MQNLRVSELRGEAKAMWTNLFPSYICLPEVCISNARVSISYINVKKKNKNSFLAGNK